MRIQHLVLQESFDDYLLKDDANKSLLSSKHMRLFLSKNNFYYKEIIIQNKPFKKKIPIFHFNKRKKEQINKNVDMEKFRISFLKNINVYNKFFEKQILDKNNNEKKINNIVIIGDNFLSESALKFLNKKYKKLYLIKNNINDLYKNKNILKLVLNISNFKSNIFIILNNDSCKKIQNSLVNRLHLDEENKIYSLRNNFIYKENVFVFKNKKFLKKKFIIKNINELIF